MQGLAGQDKGDKVLIMVTIKSSNLSNAEYDQPNKKLVVTFKNGTSYEYTGVSADVYDKFQSTFETDASSGKFFHTHIRGLPYTKLK